jgi:hypothetical protein
VGGLTNGRLAAFGLALAGNVVLGAVAGLIWFAIAPTPVFQEVAQGQAQLVNAETSAYIVADAWFVLITALAGLIAGVAGWRLLVRRSGPLAVAGLILGAGAGALVAMWVGDNVGLGTYHHLLASSASGAYLHGALALGAKSALAIWALCTAGVILVAESGGRRIPAEEDPSAMWTGEPPEAHSP